MRIEEVELTFSHTDLGDLNEFALMVLFAASQAHLLTEGTGKTLREVCDARGERLYPGYFMTHLQVPPNRRLDTFRQWERVALGCDVALFGGMVVDARYALARPGELANDPARWAGAHPHVRANALFVVDGGRDTPRPAMPRAGSLADVAKLTEPPEAMKRFEMVAEQGSLDPNFRASFSPDGPLRQPLALGRDGVAGHNLLFATFIRLFDLAERGTLMQQLAPPYPRELLEHRHVVERETFYLSNCRPDRTVRMHVRGRATGCDVELHGTGRDLRSWGILEFLVELVEDEANQLLAVCRSRQLLAVPSREQGLARDARRFVERHAG